MCASVSLSVYLCVCVSDGMVYLGPTALAATATPQRSGCADACMLSPTWRESAEASRRKRSSGAVQWQTFG